MTSNKEELLSFYGDRLRLRVCGICISDDRILMVRHDTVGPENIFWSPPGGGVHYGESAPIALIREIAEECGLIARIGELLFINEYIEAPLHAVELFFHVTEISGLPKIGIDPEFALDKQIIREVRFMTMAEIKELPESHVHSIFKNCGSFGDLLLVRGYVTNKS